MLNLQNPAQHYLQLVENLDLLASINRVYHLSPVVFLRCQNNTCTFGLDFPHGLHHQVQVRGGGGATSANGHSAVETMSSSSLSPSSLFDVISALRTMGCVCARERIAIDGHTYTVREQIAEG